MVAAEPQRSDDAAHGRDELPRDEQDGSRDSLAGLRSELELVDEVAVPDRVALFDRVNATLARELSDLDEV